MRTRSRVMNVNVSGLRKYVYERVYDSGSPPPSKTVTLQGSVNKSMDIRSESITDRILLRPEVTVNPKTGRWQRIKYPRSKIHKEYVVTEGGGIRLYRPFRPVQPCTHTKTVYEFPNSSSEFVVSGAVRVNTGGARWDTYTRSWTNPYIAMANILNHSPQNLTSMFDSILPSYTVDGYRKSDWFALSHDFTEACESFSKNKFLAGEALYECEIFVSAFKLITNPASAISTLSKFIRHQTSRGDRKKFRRMNLGQFVKHTKELGRKGINAHLSYDFAVKPAIDDIISTLDAHDFVSRRMKYLSDHSGSFVPIRVRKQLASDYVNAPPGPLAPGVSSRMYKLCDSKITVGTISAWGRVRQDLDWEDTWNAYLQYFGVGKAVGLLWELIPFSFVVDWVTNAQEFIDNQTRLRTGGPFVSIRNICASEKNQLIEVFHLNPGKFESFQIQAPSGTVEVAKKTTSVYSRFTSIPETSGLVDFSNLGSFHYTKLAELIVQLWSK